MLEHILVDRVERGIVNVWGEHDLTSDPGQTPKGLLMQLGPDLRTGAEHQQANRLAAVTQRHHEQPRAPVLAAVRIPDHGAGAVIDLGCLAGRRLDYCAGFRRLAGVQLRDEATDALIAGCETT